MVPISLATQPIVTQAALSAGSAALFAGVGAAGAKRASAAATSLVLPAAVAALRGGAGTAAATEAAAKAFDLTRGGAGNAAATEAAAKAFDLTRARIRLEGLSAYGVSCVLFSRCSCPLLC